MSTSGVDECDDNASLSDESATNEFLTENELLSSTKFVDSDRHIIQEMITAQRIIIWAD